MVRPWFGAVLYGGAIWTFTSDFYPELRVWPAFLPMEEVILPALLGLSSGLATLFPRALYMIGFVLFVAIGAFTLFVALVSHDSMMEAVPRVMFGLIIFMLLGIPELLPPPATGSAK